MNSGIKISTSGDVTQASILQQAVSSDIPNLMVLDGQQPPHYGNADYTFASNPVVGTQFNVVTVPHGLGFIPASAFDWSNLNGTLYGTGRLDLIAGGFASFRGYADATNFLIDFIRTNDASAVDLTGEAWLFRYYIFCTPAT